MSQRTRVSDVFITSHSKKMFASSETTTSYKLGTVTDSGSGADRKNWKDVIAQGGDATNAYVGNVTVCRPSSGSYSVSAFHPKTFSRFTEYGSGNYRTPPLSFPVIPDADGIRTANADARTRLLAQLRSINTDWESGPFLGELFSAMRMIRRPTQDLFQEWERYVSRARRAADAAARNLKKRSDETIAAYRRRVRAQQARAVNSTYLEATFGWMPLISDIENGATAMARAMAMDRSSRTRVTGAAQSEKTTRSVTEGAANGTVYRETISTTYSQRSGYRLVAGVDRTQGASNVLRNPKLCERLGLTMRNFVPTLYQLLPYSFIVDYFSNLGDVIDSAFTDTSSVTWVSESYRTISEWTISATCNVAATQARLQTYGLQLSSASGGISCVSRQVKVTRNRLNGVPMPNFTVHIPSPIQWVNVAAVVAQKLT